MEKERAEPVVVPVYVREEEMVMQWDTGRPAKFHSPSKAGFYLGPALHIQRIFRMIIIQNIPHDDNGIFRMMIRNIYTEYSVG